MTITVRIEGLDGVVQAMRTFPIKLQRRALVPAMRAGARVVQQEVKSQAPVRTGAIRRNVTVKRGLRKFDRGLVARFVVGVKHGKITRTRKLKNGRVRIRTEDPYYFRFQELGYTAVGRRKAAGRAERAARKLGLGTGRRVPGKKFLSGGLKDAAPRAFEAFRSRLATEIQRLT